MSYKGDRAVGSTVRGWWNSPSTSTGLLVAFDNAAVSVYKNSDNSETTTGVTVSASADSRTGFNRVAIDTSSDGTFYDSGSDFAVVITGGSYGTQAAAGILLFEFSLNLTSALRPTTAGRTLDVSAAGNAGIDWSNVEAPTTALALTGTTIATSQVVASVTGAVGSVTGAVGSVTGAVGSVTGNVGGNVVGTVASVVGNVGGNVVGTVASVVGNVGGNVVGSVASVVGNVGGNVVGSVGSVVATVNAALTGTSLTKLTELWERQGLDITKPVLVTPTSISWTSITLGLSTVGTDTTIQRA